VIRCIIAHALPIRIGSSGRSCRKLTMADTDMPVELRLRCAGAAQTRHRTTGKTQPMNDYVPIFEEICGEVVFALERLVDQDGALLIELWGDDNRRLNVAFDSYVAYLKMDEGDAILMLGHMKRSGGTTKTFYRVENSEFMSWFHLQSCSVRSNQSLIHYAIGTVNDIVDVLALSPPQITTL
jgi:hypothetical protein